MSRLLVDTGPLVAILDAGDSSHERCRAYLEDERRPLLTTWPVVTEAMYLLGASLEAQQSLLGMIETRKLEIAEIVEEVGRISTLISKYADTPMDFADGSLVAVAERQDLDTVFSLDDDFRVYRIRGRRAFRVVP